MTLWSPFAFSRECSWSSTCHESTEFNFLLIDAKGKVEEQQSMLRQLICQHIDLDAYRKEG